MSSLALSNRGSSIEPFCNHSSAAGIDQLGCTTDRGAVSYCNLASFGSALPADYQVMSCDLTSYLISTTVHFSISLHLVANYGGTDTLADYCPFQDVCHGNTTKGMTLLIRFTALCTNGAGYIPLIGTQQGITLLILYPFRSFLTPAQAEEQLVPMLLTTSILLASTILGRPMDLTLCV